MPHGRSLLVGLAVVTVLMVSLAVPVAAADNIVRTTIPVDETRTFPLGPEAACFGVPEGTAITVRFTGEIIQTEFVSGPNAGRIQVRGKESFTFTVPATGTRGSGSQVFNFKAKDDGSFVSMNVVHVNGMLPDGTAFRATFHFHTVVKNAQVKNDIIRLNCR